MKLGFIGAGQLGGPMLERLAAAGHRPRLYARRPEVAAAFPEVEAAGSAAELAADSDVLIVCLFSDDQLRELVGEVAGALKPDALLVSHTTATPGGVDAIDGALAGRFVDAPVSGTAEHIRRGELTVLLGGEAGALDRVEPLLAAYCGTRLRTGGVGSATRLKLLNNLWFTANVQVTGLAVRLGEELGLDESTVLGAVAHCSANSAALGYVRQFGSLDAFGEQAGGYLRKDVASIRDAASASGIDLGPLGRLATTGPVEAVIP